MNIHILALQLMALQGLLGAFDTVYHHEITESLATKISARKELFIHAIRASFYSILFIGLSAWKWHGVFAILLMMIFITEIFLTLWDFVIEDKTRLLPATERVTHTILAMNGGAFVMLLALNIPQWFSKASEFQFEYQGALSIFLALCGIGVGLSAIRDATAAFNLKKCADQELKNIPLNFSDKSQSVLVTGATGFIGKKLVHKLIADGKRVTILTRNPKKAAWLFDGKVVCIKNMDELPANYIIDIIINLAGARILGWRWTPARKAVICDSRIALTKKIVDWISGAQHKPALFLSASAIGYYGIQKIGENAELTENSKTQPIFMSQFCSDWEHAAQSAEQFGVKVVRMRFGLVLGREGALPMLLLPIKLFLGGALGSGKQIMSWIHIDDLLKAMAHIWRMNESDKKSLVKSAYNLTAPETLSQLNFSKIAAKLLNRPCFFLTPGWIMRLMLGEQSNLLLEGQNVVPSNLIASGFKFTYPNANSALRNLLGIEKKK